MTTHQPIRVNDQLFLGRVQEQENFRQLLTNVLSKPKGEVEPAIVLLYGGGGMGKSTLARRLCDIANSEPPFEGACQTVWLDWEDERFKQVTLQVGRENIQAETVFDRLHACLLQMNSSWGRSFKRYQQLQTLRREAEQAVQQALTPREEHDALTQQLVGVTTGLLAKALRMGVPMVGEMGEQVTQAFLQAGVQVGAGGAYALRAQIEARLQARLDKTQYELFLHPQEQLARALGEGLAQIAKRKPLLFFLDTYEIVDEVDVWMREIMQSAGPNVMWILAGRQNLRDSRPRGRDYFRGYSDRFTRRLQTIDMRQLAQVDVQVYIEEVAPERPLSETDILALTQVIQGIPLAMREVGTLWAKGVALAEIMGDIDWHTPHQQLVDQMTGRYLLHVVLPEDELALYALALAEGNMVMLSAMLTGETHLPARLAELRQSYQAIHLQEARLHDAPATFLQATVWRPERRQDPRLQTMQSQAVEALQTTLTKLQAELPLLEEQAIDDEWVQWSFDLIRTCFWLDESKGWQQLLPCFVVGLAYNNTLAQGVLEIAQRCHLGRRGQNRLKALMEGIADESTQTARQKMVTVLEKAARLTVGWLIEPEQRAIVAWQQGLVATQQKHYEEAVRIFNHVYELLPDKGEQLREQVAQDMSELAKFLIWGDDTYKSSPHPSVVELLKKAVQCDPNNKMAWYRLGVAYSDVKQQDESIKAYHQAIYLDVTFSAPHNGLGNVYFELERFDEALKAYKQAIRLAPQDAIAYHNLGNLYHKKNNQVEAITAYKKAIALDSTYSYPYGGLGSVYLNQGKHEEARRIFEKAVNKGIDDLHVHIGLAILSLKTYQFEKAKNIFSEIINQGHQNISVYSGLGATYYRLRNYEEAIKTYKMALSLDNTHAFIYVALASCYKRLDWLEEYNLTIQKVEPLVEQQDTYNQACFASICGKIDEAFILLEQAISEKPHWKEAARVDPDFDFIRDDPRFEPLILKA